MSGNGCYNCFESSKKEHCVRNNDGYIKNKYFCSVDCMKQYVDGICCQQCHRTTNLEKMENGLLICINDTFNNQFFPRCKDLYTRDYYCDLCKSHKNTDDIVCYAIHRDDIDEICRVKIKCLENRSFVYCCYDCIGPVESLYWVENEGFRKLYNLSNIYDKIIDRIKYALNIGQPFKFTCNGCDGIIENKCPRIHEKKNLCENCYDYLLHLEID